MAVSILGKEIHDIKIVRTAKNPGGTIGAHGGAAESLTPTAPDGYKFLTHIAVWNTGVIGIVASFDGLGIYETVNVYQNNTTNGSLGRGAINLLTAYYK